MEGSALHPHEAEPSSPKKTREREKLLPLSFLFARLGIMRFLLLLELSPMRPLDGSVSFWTKTVCCLRWL